MDHPRPILTCPVRVAGVFRLSWDGAHGAFTEVSSGDDGAPAHVVTRYALATGEECQAWFGAPLAFPVLDPTFERVYLAVGGDWRGCDAVSVRAFPGGAPVAELPWRATTCLSPDGSAAIQPGQGLSCVERTGAVRWTFPRASDGLGTRGWLPSSRVWIGYAQKNRSWLAVVDAASGAVLSDVRLDASLDEDSTVSPDGTRLAGRSYAKRTWTPVWLDTATGKLLPRPVLPADAFLYAFSPDGRQVAVLGRDGAVTVLADDATRVVAHVQAAQDEGSGQGLAWSGDGGRLAVHDEARRVVLVYDARAWGP